MKTAVILTGHMRNTFHSKNIHSIVRHLIEPQNADVYGWFWSDVGMKLNTGSSIPKENPGFLPSGRFNFELVRDLIPDVKLSINDYKLHHDRFVKENGLVYELMTKFKLDESLNRPLALRSQWFTWKQGFEMVEQSGIEYDIVVRTRPDLCLNGDMIKVFEPGNIHFNRWHTKIDIEDYRPLEDIIIYGEPRLMKRFCNLYVHWNRYLRRLGDTKHHFDIVFNPHRLYNYHCEQMQLNVKSDVRFPTGIVGDYNSSSFKEFDTKSVEATK